MLTRILKLAAVVALAWLLVALGRSFANYGTIWAASVIFAAAIVAFSQAVRQKSYGWAAMFIGVVALFNPVWPVMLARNVFLRLDAACILLFLVSFSLLNTPPRLSLASVTALTPPGESL
jgi:hypothetical protein